MDPHILSYSELEREWKHALEHADLEKVIQMYELKISRGCFVLFDITHCKRLDVLIWAESIGLKIKEYYNMILENACANNKIDIVEWLYDKGYDINNSNPEAIYAAFRGGHLELSMWLFEHGADINYDENICTLCVNKHLDILKWLQTVGCNNQNNYNLGFRKACKYYNISVAKYLISIYPNILPKNMFDIPTSVLKELGVPKNVISLVKCVNFGLAFPNIEDIDDIFVESLFLNNNIDILSMLADKFSFIQFEVLDDNIVNFGINRSSVKNARNI